MLVDVVFMGSEEDVAARLTELFSWRAGEIIGHPMVAGNDPDASWRRTLELLGTVQKTL